MKLHWSDRFDAGRLEPGIDPIDAHVALRHRLGRLVKAWNIKRTPGHAVLTPDAIILIEVDDPIRVLHDGAGCRTRKQTTRVLAVKTGVLLDHPQEVSLDFHLVEPHQQPRVRAQVLVTLKAAEVRGRLDLQVVPLLAGHLTALAANAFRDVNELGILRRVRPQRVHRDEGARSGGHATDGEVIAHACSRLTKKLLNSGHFVFASPTKGVSWLAIDPWVSPTKPQ